MSLDRQPLFDFERDTPQKLTDRDGQPPMGQPLPCLEGTGQAGGVNLYQYAPNPVQWVDPLGLSKKQEDNCPNIVYRALTPNEKSSIARGDGINRPTPYHRTTPEQHVGGTQHSRNPWISTTRNKDTAMNKYAAGGESKVATIRFS